MEAKLFRPFFSEKILDNNLLATSPLIFLCALFFSVTAGLETVSVPTYSSTSDSAAKVVGKLLVDAKVIR